VQTIRASLGFAILLTVFIIGPAYLPATFGPYPSLRWGDIVDLFTPVVVLPAAWLLFQRAGVIRPSTAQQLLFVALAGLWASAQGMHLAANAIGHLVPADLGDGGQLTYDLDEVLSHYLWHAALLGLTALIAYRAVRGQPEPDAAAIGALVMLGIAAALFGFTFFVMVTEGQTGPMSLPVAAVIAAAIVLVARGGILQRPGAALFATGYLLALVLCLIWAGMHDWQLIEFSKTGIIE
jgi:hypothetical protein